VPAATGELAATPGKAVPDCCVVGDPAAESVAYEDRDGISFVD